MTSIGQTTPAAFGRVRWRRFTFILAPSIFLAVLLLTLTAQSVLAVSLNISGRPFIWQPQYCTDMVSSSLAYLTTRLSTCPVATGLPLPPLRCGRPRYVTFAKP